MSVFVLDKRKKPLMPCTEKRARLLLGRKRAVIHRVYPFTIRMKDRMEGEIQPVRVKLDPGSKVTGIALVRESGASTRKAHALLLAELVHRGKQISEALSQRRAFRRRRRGANLRYRVPRFDNRKKPEGWLPPSLQHRVDTTMAWVNKLRRLAPVSALSIERVKFDMQLIQNPEISGVKYQKGTLAGYEAREYLLEKWGRKCAYCDAQDVPLQEDHIHPKSQSGSNRVSNLTLACRSCNQKKNNQDIREFLASDPKRLARILAESKVPLRDAAAVNATRNALYRNLTQTGLPVESGTGGQTKWNRHRMNFPKTHILDALCVGSVDTVEGADQPGLTIKSVGRGSYQRTRLNTFGFPRGFLTRKKSHFGFQTGDIVKAIIPKGKHQGCHTGRVAVRASGKFNFQTVKGVIQGISHRLCKRIQRADGYGYFNIKTRRSAPP